MAEFKDSYITEEERKALLIQNLADRPNAMSSYGRAKMSAEDLKKAFDKQFNLVVGRHNLLHESVEEIRGEAQTERLESRENRTGTLEGRADTLDTRADTLEDRADTLDTRADTLEDRADTLDTRADTLEDRADTVEGRLGDQNAANSIEGVIQRVADLESLLDDPENQETFKDDYKTLSTQVKSNATNTLANAASISKLDQRIQNNETSISNLNTSVQKNSQDIQTNAQDIQTNAGQIGDINDYLDRDPSDRGNIFLDVYPVGSIYMSMKGTSPSSLFGGTWEQLQSQFLLAANNTASASAAPKYNDTASGGEEKHKLTAAELPTHTHKAALVNTSWSGSTSGLDTAKVGTLTTTGGTQQALTITPDYNSTLGWEHNNMPPYLAVYMWKRTA
jgi:chaperonin cofactor prefoldin